MLGSAVCSRWAKHQQLDRGYNLNTTPNQSVKYRSPLFATTQGTKSVPLLRWREKENWAKAHMTNDSSWWWDQFWIAAFIKLMSIAFLVFLGWDEECGFLPARECSSQQIPWSHRGRGWAVERRTRGVREGGGGGGGKQLGANDCCEWQRRQFAKFLYTYLSH